ncbi:MAG: hypothetical protein BroJett011_33660 [Chloroflexota bacterium]|nr:MAG: hypothetical protein BroJett011_33660 [Chloroflexota bacterium]
MTKYLITITATVTLIVVIVFYQTIVQALLIVGYTAAALLTLAGLGGLFFGGWYFKERIGILRAQRRQADRESHVTVVTDNGQTWIRDTDSHATWRNLTGSPALYVNGKQAQPEAWELELYRLRLLALAAGRGRHDPTFAALPDPIEANPLDLLEVCTQPGQAYAIIGGQQTGKTWQARHIANFWIRQGYKPVVVGPKWDHGEWGGCYLLGGNGDFEAVGRGIAIIRRLAETRHADTTKSHKAHSIQPVFFDDWTPIVDQVDNARALILEATTLYSSVNILLYFVLHADTAAAWGTDKKGAALKDNFVKLFIVPTYDQTGMVVRSQTRGYIRFAGETVDRPARLFTTPPADLGQPMPLLFPEVEITNQAGTCPVCGNPVTGKATYCSNACKQSAYRQRVTAA